MGSAHYMPGGIWGGFVGAHLCMFLIEALLIYFCIPKYLLSIIYMPSTIPDIWNRATDQDAVTSVMEFVV